MYKHNYFSKKRVYSELALTIFFIFLSLFIFCLGYYFYLNSMIHKDCGEYLEETTKQIENNVKSRIDDYYAFLQFLSNSISTEETGSIRKWQVLVDRHKEDLDFQHFLLIDSNYIGYRNNGQPVFIPENSNLKDTILKKEQSILTQQTIDNEKVIILAVPVENVQVDGKNIVALAVSIEMQSFGQIASITNYNPKGYSFILNKEDKSIIGVTTNSTNTDDTVFNEIQKFLEEDNSILAELNTKGVKNQNNLIDFNVNATELMMIHKSIKELDIELLSVVLTSKIHKYSNLLLKVTVLPLGAVLLITAILSSVLLISYRRHRLKLENIAYVDPITEGNTLQGFYKLAKETLTSSNRKQYALVYTNIKNFKVLNEQLGHCHCDRILKALYESIDTNLTFKEIVGRVTADHFCVLLEYENRQRLLNRFDIWYAHTKHKMEKLKYSQWVHPEMEFGVYVIDDRTLPFQQMITRAKLALRDVAPINGSKLQLAFYDDQLRSQLLREKQIEDMMEESLENGEFQIYLQPKYSLPDERIVGAEALTRWHSKSEGMIYPDEFIPLFEKNGFIIQLDLWVFKEVCKMIRGWLDAGLQPVKVSINCSRVHFKKKDFFKEYITIANTYNIPPNLLEVELTESLVLEDVQQFSQIIQEIRGAGFGCSVDDFGSGYSSLSIIENFPVDTLKLDKTFFRQSTKDRKRTEAVISSIIAMAHALSMKIVAEGVEEREQVELLKRLGCHFIQGYVFAKPMPIDAFERLFK